MIETHQIVEQVQHVNKFTNKIDAVAYQQINGGMIVKEQNLFIWYVIRPEFDDVRQLALPMTEAK